MSAGDGCYTWKIKICVIFTSARIFFPGLILTCVPCACRMGM